MKHQIILLRISDLLQETKKMKNEMLKIINRIDKINMIIIVMKIDK